MSKKKTSEKEIAELVTDWHAKIEECQAGWQRTQAEFENYRKRVESDRAGWARLATAEALVQMAPILDDFRRAFAHLPADETDSSWVAGMRQVEKHFRNVLVKAGLEPIAEGGSFDPNLHEAIAYEHHPELAEDSIIDVIELGWKLAGRVIKPAKVRVSRGQADGEWRMANGE